MTLSELAERMTPRELRLWQRYRAEVRPLGASHAEQVSGLQTLILAASRGARLSLDDCLPHWSQPDPSEPDWTKQEQIALKIGLGTGTYQQVREHLLRQREKAKARGDHRQPESGAGSDDERPGEGAR